MKTTLDSSLAGPGNRSWPLLRTASGIAAVAALCIGAAPLLGVVSPPVPAAYPSWPVLLLLGLLPPALSAFFLGANRPAAARAVLLAAGALAPSALLDDAQLLVDPGVVTDPALFLRESLRPLAPSSGAWLLSAGHVMLGGAGVLAWTARSAPAGTGERSPVGRRQGLLAGVLCTAVLGAIGALLARFVSTDPFVLTGGGPDASVPVFAGDLLLAITVPLVAGVAVSSVDADTARGGLLGLAAALAGTTVPALGAVLFHAELSIGWGTILELVAVSGFAVLALPAGRVVDSAPASAEIELPGHDRLSAAAGILAMLGGALAVVAALSPQLRTADGEVGLAEYANLRQLLVAGCVFALLGAALLFRRGRAARPALAVAWVIVVLAGAASLDIVLHVARATGAELLGFGTWLTVAAILLSGAAACCAGLAGGAERDEVDLSETTADRSLIVPTVLLGLLTVAAFTLPVLTAPDYVPLGILTEFGIASWGLLCAVLAVPAALVLVPLARGERAAGLLAGCALVLSMRALQAPLTASGVPDSAPGAGLWCALAGAVLAVGTAIPAARSRS
ncbi:hypothetical protein FHR84_001787 [Actinopolyspora biskrensis]|uniref:Uncharacterized protein n=1 Tax=Actinopolyspora biskrensis TaxID=1470178 RepID=A0A852YXK7_9ACTN|nr:hypothetical protein [Actinopolyspora biskrensis]NYH78462.1 hypothetical protein [Actinopolyspora biskrensis]